MKLPPMHPRSPGHTPKLLTAILILIGGAALELRAEVAPPVAPAPSIAPAPEPGNADPTQISDSEVLNRTPTLTADEMRQVLFSPSWTYAPNGGVGGLDFELHNPFRNKTLVGLVLNISYKDQVSGKSVNYQALVRVNCGPLGSSDNGPTYVFKQPKDETDERIVTLEEVHYLP